MKPGTRVRYTNAWLWFTGNAPAGAPCHYRGTVVSRPDVLGSMDPHRFVVVEWDHDPQPVLLNSDNVAPDGTAKQLDNPVMNDPIARSHERRKRGR